MVKGSAETDTLDPDARALQDSFWGRGDRTTRSDRSSIAAGDLVPAPRRRATRTPKKRRGRTLLALVLAGCTPTPHADTPAGPRGLQQPVTVVTDEWGIPHVEARTLGDVYHAWGWVVARDRLWQLLDSRARSEGVEHLWLGNSALASDGGAQLFRITERAEG